MSEARAAVVESVEPLLFKTQATQGTVPSADLEVGDTAGLETCATGRIGLPTTEEFNVPR
jgi:hypothetical protein